MDANHSVTPFGEEYIENYDEEFFSSFTIPEVQPLYSPNPRQFCLTDPGLLVNNVEKETVLERHQDNSLTSNATQGQGHHWQTPDSLYGSGSERLPVPVDVQENKKPGIFVQQTLTPLTATPPSSIVLPSHTSNCHLAQNYVIGSVNPKVKVLRIVTTGRSQTPAPYGRTPTPEKDAFKVSAEVGRIIPAAPAPYGRTPTPEKNAFKVSAEVGRIVPAVSQAAPAPYGRTPTPEKNAFKVSAEVGRIIPAVSQAAPLPDHGTPHVGRSSSTVLVNQKTKTERTISSDRKDERMWQKPDYCEDPEEKKKRANARKARHSREKQKKEKEELKGQVQLAIEELKKMQKTMDEERQKHGLELDELKTELTKEQSEKRIVYDMLFHLINSGQIPCVTGPGNESAVVQIVQNP